MATVPMRVRAFRRVDVAVDSRSNRLLWRGWAERGLEGVIDDQTWMDEVVDDAVRRIMERFPS